LSLLCPANKYAQPSSNFAPTKKSRVTIEDLGKLRRFNSSEVETKKVDRFLNFSPLQIDAFIKVGPSVLRKLIHFFKNFNFEVFEKIISFFDFLIKKVFPLTQTLLSHSLYIIQRIE